MWRVSPFRPEVLVWFTLIILSLSLVPVGGESSSTGSLQGAQGQHRYAHGKRSPEGACSVWVDPRLFEPLPARPDAANISIHVSNTRLYHKGPVSFFMRMWLFGSGRYNFKTPQPNPVRFQVAYYDDGQHAARLQDRAFVAVGSSETCQFGTETNGRNQSSKDVEWNFDFLCYWTDESGGRWDADPSKEPGPAFLPLTPFYNFQHVTYEEIIPSPARSLTFNLMCSLSTSHDRVKLHAALDQDAKDLEARDWQYLMAVPHDWVEPSNEVLGRNVSDRVDPESYRKTLLASVFTICPKGNNVHTYRMWEASEAGSIPVVIDGASDDSCINTTRPFLESKAPFIWARDWADAKGQMLDLLTTNSEGTRESKLCARQKQLLEWYYSFNRAVALRVESTLAMTSP